MTMPVNGTNPSRPPIESKPLMRYDEFCSTNRLPDSHETIVLFQVYQDLIYLRKWTNVRVAKSPSRSYLAGSAPAGFDSVFPGRGDKEPDLDRTQVIVPVCSTDTFAPRSLQGICRECVHPEKHHPMRCITLALVDDTSNTAYYRIFDKWSEIVHPQWKMMKKRRRRRGVENGKQDITGMKDGVGEEGFEDDDGGSSSADSVHTDTD